ncbi:MAG: DUF2600 family protein [Solirubrobacteraceae bacterium]
MTAHPQNRPVCAFLSAARTYWCEVWPCLRREMHHWRRRAESIPDRTLRRTALEAQADKAGNLEGAVAFAAFTPRRYRRASTRAMAAFELAFDYVDCLSEMPNSEPIRNGRQLSQALIAAVAPGGGQLDYYAYSSFGDDGGYLSQLVQTCQKTLVAMPSYSLISEPVSEAAMRIVEYQTYNHGDAYGSHDAFRRWAETQHGASMHQDLHWWEYAAAHGSSLLVFALIAAASNAETGSANVQAIQRAYLPWIGAANSLLDSLVDQVEDAEPGQHRLLDYYANSRQAGERLQYIVDEASRYARVLDPSNCHALIVAAMVSFYITGLESNTSVSAATCAAIRRSGGLFVRPTTWVMRARQRAANLAGKRACRTAIQS